MSNLAFIDTETTGLKDPHVVQIAVRVVGIGVRTTLVRPPVPIEIEAMAIHHITEEMVRDEPTMAELASGIREFIGDRVLVMHNAKFDLRALANDGLVFENKVICTLKCVRALHPFIPKHALQYLRYYWGLRVDAGAHDAVSDTAVLERVFYRIMDVTDDDPSNDAWNNAIAKLINISA